MAGHADEFVLVLADELAPQPEDAGGILVVDAVAGGAKLFGGCLGI